MPFSELQKLGDLTDRDEESSVECTYDSNFLTESQLDKLLHDIHNTRRRVSTKSSNSALYVETPYKPSHGLHDVDSSEESIAECPTTAGYTAMFKEGKKEKKGKKAKKAMKAMKSMKAMTARTPSTPGPKKPLVNKLSPVKFKSSARRRAYSQAYHAAETLSKQEVGYIDRESCKAFAKTAVHNFLLT